MKYQYMNSVLELQKKIDDSTLTNWENSLDPNARYWKNNAVDTFGDLCKMVGPERADELTGNWDDGRTWKEIYQQAVKIKVKLELEGESSEDKTSGDV